MKKIMTFAMILMPLIVLGILFLSGTVVNSSTYLYVDYIQFVDENIVLNKDSDEPVFGTVKVNVFPKLANNKDIEYWSDNEQLVTVDQDGTITGLDFGQTYIFAKSKENATKIASCKVTVTSDKVHRLWVEDVNTTMYKNEKQRLQTKYLPLEAKNATFEYQSSNPQVLYVSPDGELTAKSKGKSKITIYVKNDPEKKIEIDINVKIRVEDIWIEDSSPVFSAKTSFKFPTVNFLPETAEENIVYQTSDPTIATVDQNGNITFSKAGTVQIFASVEGVENTLQKNYTSTYGYISSVSFSTNNAKVLNFEDWQDKDPQFEYTFLPADADVKYLEKQTTNQDVIKIENGNFKVVGGGSVTIKIVGYTSKDTTTVASWSVFVNRNVQSISFGVSDFCYTSQTTLDLNTTFLPLDANQNILYTVSDPSIAQIENDTVVFSSATKNNQYGKVKVTAYTESGVSKTITVVYLDQNLQTISVDNQTDFDFDLPKTGQPNLVFALILNNPFAQDIEYVIKSGQDKILQNGFVFNPVDNGTVTIDVVVNAIVFKTVQFEIKRKVEEIQSFKIVGTWQNFEPTVYESENVYSSSKVFEFQYTLFPQNTTNKVLNFKVDGDCASIVDGKLVFSKAGKVQLTAYIDNIEKHFEIESTFEHPDSSTTVSTELQMTKGQKTSVWDCLQILPQNADKSFVTFSAMGDVVNIVDENICALRGGNDIVNVCISTTNGETNVQINIFVQESAQQIGIVGESFVFYEQNNIDISEKFFALPITSNCENQISFYSENQEIAAVSKQGIVSFKKAGYCVICAKLPNDFVAKIGMVFAGESLVVDGLDTSQKILYGTTFIIRPSKTALQNATFDEVFVGDENCKISDGIFVEILGDTTISFGENNYNFQCVSQMTNVVVGPKNLQDVDVENKRYITGLESVCLFAQVHGVESKYINLQYISADNQIAQIDQDGKITFLTEGETKFEIVANYNSDIIGANQTVKTANITIYSSFGRILSLSLKENANCQYTVDDINPNNNVVDVSNLIDVYPSQIDANLQNTKLEVLNKNMASVDGLNVLYGKGGSFDVDVKIKNGQNFVLALTINFDIKKNAEGIMIDNILLEDECTISLHKSTVYLSPQIYPVDANTNCQISWAVLENNDVANVDIEKYSIAFEKANQTIKTLFVLGAGDSAKQFVVYFCTSRITYEVDIDSESYVVPMNEPFAFVSSEGEISDFEITFDDVFDISRLDDDVFVANNSASGYVSVDYKNNTKTVQFVSVSNFQTIQNVKISDVDMEGQSVQIDAIENKLCLVTASKSVEILYEIPTGFDKYGNILKYQIVLADTDVAFVEGTTILFEKEGIARATIVVEFEDVYQQKNITFSFEIQSTFENVAQFEISQTQYNFVYDNLTEEEKTFDIKNTITRTFPQYGLAENFEIKADDKVVTLTDDNKILICGSGLGKIQVCWGKTTETINIQVDKYIDKIVFVADGQTASQVVTKSKQYKLNYQFVANDQRFLSTINDIVIVASQGCTVNSDTVLFDATNTKCDVTISAKYGSASTVVKIVYVDQDVNVLMADAQLENVLLEKDQKYIFDFRYQDKVVNMSQYQSENILFVDQQINVFKSLYGYEGTILFDNNQQIAYITTEDVEQIIFDENALVSGSITAMGDEKDGKGIILSQYLGAHFLPITARNKDGAFEIQYSLEDTDKAYIQDGKLCFENLGQVTIIVKAGAVQEKITIESTMGFAKSVVFEDDKDMTFEYTEKSYDLPQNLYRVYPADAYKYNAVLTSSNEDVFKVDGEKLIFVGGGKANLNVCCNISASNTISISKQISIINRATGIVFYDQGIQVGYMVKNQKNSTMILNYDILSDGTMSDFNVITESSDTTVATINKNVVSFVGDGETTITVKIQDKTNQEDVFDIVATLKIYNNKDFNIQNVSDDTQFVLEILDQRQCILYPMANTSSCNFEFVVEDGVDVLSVDDIGQISCALGGNAKILIKDKNSQWSKIVNVFVYKKAQINLLENNIYTSKDQWDINATFESQDALVSKTIQYISDNPQIATVDNGHISFLQAGSVTISINILYEGKIETSAKFEIKSTCGKVDSFEITQTAISLYVGQKITIGISNILPNDFVGNLEISNTNQISYETNTIDAISFEVIAQKSGAGNITVEYSESTDFSQNISVTIIQLSTGIDFVFDDCVVTNLKTFVNDITIVAVVKPTDSSDKGVTWEVVSGDVSVNNGNIIFNSFGTAVVRAKANDGASSNTITIQYVHEIDDFDLSYMGDVLSDGQTVYLDWNQNKVVLKILIVPDTINDFDDYSYFEVQTQSQNSSVSIDSDGNIIVVTIDSTNFPIYEDTITVNYKDKFTKNIKLYRDGIQSIDFGNHDNTLDTNYGMQQMRLFGNKSFYDGAIQNYYMMPVNIAPSNSLLTNVVWTTSNQNVTIESCDGYIKIDFSNLSGSTIEQLYNDDFSAGEVVVTATSISGKATYSYVFHIVSGTNIFDESGYLNTSGTVILHSSLTPSKYCAKSTIIGNGYLLDISAKNSTSDSAYENNEYVRVEMANLINLSLNGAASASDEKYINLIVSGKTVYCNLKYMYRTMAVSGAKLKRTTLSSFTYAGILSQISSGIYWLEDVIMFDVGPRGIEVQAAGNIYVKGFLDIYNWQNKSKVANAFGDIGKYISSLGSVILNLAKDYKITKNGEDWVNMAGISTKGKDFKFYYYDNSTDTYVFDNTDGGVHDSASGLCRISDTIGFGIKGVSKFDITAWVYKPDHEYLTWENEYNSDGSLNNQYMISTVTKLNRLNF